MIPSHITVNLGPSPWVRCGVCNLTRTFQSEREALDERIVGGNLEGRLRCVIINPIQELALQHLHGTPRDAVMRPDGGPAVIEIVR